MIDGKLARFFPRFPKVRVLVIGDLILDEFIWGDVSRISPEAPVPVVWVQRESFMPGGACNVASNVRSLGGEVTLAGIVGDDARGRNLLGELSRQGIDVSGIVTDPHRPTTQKTRVIAHHQQVVRIDREDPSAVEGPVLKRMVAAVREKIDEVDALIIEDYGKGVVTAGLLREVVEAARRRGKIVTVDPKEEHFNFYRGVTSITPNHHEAGRAAGFAIKDEATLERAGKTLLKRLNCESVLITRGEQGMSLFEKRGRVTHIPTVAQEVFDVSGAGDTVISAFTLALAAGASKVEAAFLSNVAAGIVVGKVGIAVVTPEELRKRLSNGGRRRN